ncbi:MAG: hypothetical protein R3C69_01990 [Geminicoccaceae bacterium]
MATRHAPGRSPGGRYAFTVGVILPAVLWRHHQALWPVPSPWLQPCRGLGQLAATFLFFLTLTYLPLADTVALAFLYPLVTPALAPWCSARRSAGGATPRSPSAFWGRSSSSGRAGFFQPAAPSASASAPAGAVYFLITRRPPARRRRWSASSMPPSISLCLLDPAPRDLAAGMEWADWGPSRSSARWVFLCHGLLIHAFESAPGLGARTWAMPR